MACSLLVLLVLLLVLSALPLVAGDGWAAVFSPLFWFGPRFLLFRLFVLADLVDSPTELPALEALAESVLGTVKLDLFELRRDCCRLPSPLRGLLVWVCLV